MHIGWKVLGGVCLAIGLVWVLETIDLLGTRFFAPKRAAVAREVFENTPSYIKGTLQDLQDLQLEYQKASKEHKRALRTVILHKAVEIEERHIPSDLKDFISSLRSES